MQVKKIRLSKNLSVPQLSALSGLSRRTIQDIEARGDCLVSNAHKLAAALNVSMNDLCKNPELIEDDPN
jgi:transcriptional regulator with XRE-family HTH domain